MPIETLATYLPRLGRISLGYKTRNDKGVVHPMKAKTICFTSDVESRLAHLAGVYGGKVKEAIPGPDGLDRWLLISDVTEIAAMIPSNDLNLVQSQWMELHTASGLKRRCDGVRVVTGKEVDEETGEITLLEDVPCICKALDLEGPEACKPTLRLNVVLPDALDAEGLGVWLVTSTGWRSNQHVASALKMIELSFGGRLAGIPLSLGMREAKAQVPGTGKHKGKMVTSNYQHFTLNTSASLREALTAIGGQRTLAEQLTGVTIDKALPAPADVPSGDEPTVEERRAEFVEPDLPDEGGEAPWPETGAPVEGQQQLNGEASDATEPRATKVQINALHRLARGDLAKMLAERHLPSVEELSVDDASRLISELQAR